jgi:hypothetical protein
MFVLYCGSCASTKKAVNATEMSETTTVKADSVRKEVRILQGQSIPSSETSLRVPVDSLRKLPEGASYTSKSGQAGIRLAVRGDSIEATATCDSLWAELDYYESLYWTTREERDRYKEAAEARTETESSTKGVSRGLVMIITLIVGMIAGAVITNKVKQNG